MTKVWMYSVAANSDPDYINCVVPWRVDEELIFFGPCKKRIRKCLREQYLGSDTNHCDMTDDLFIVGVNGSNQKQIRKVVWAGKLSEVMTFAEADRRLRGERFRNLREHSFSPLHVSPIMKSGKLIGYEHVSKEHSKGGEWVSDLVSNAAKPNVRVEGRKLILNQGTPWKAFDRDCCMLLENRFFALGQGIAIDEEALEILQQSQPERSGVGPYAVFGLTANGQAKGLRGTFLEIPGDLASRFIAWLGNRSRKAAKHQRRELDGFPKRCCT